MLILAMVLATAAGAAEYESRKDHKEYDFHYDIRYPGRLRSDVGRDKVTQEDAKDLKAYHRRVVTWWPKRGVDFTPLEDIPGAPLRTWTPRVPKDSRSGVLPDNFPKEPFKAHLVNFRGVGDDALKDVSDPESYRCPAAVLRFEDGHKRVILAKYLSEPDRRFLMETYNKDMARIQGTLLQDEYAVNSEALAMPEGEAYLFKHPGKIRFDTKHASIVIPGKSQDGQRSFVKEDQREQVLQTVAYLKNQMEAYWAYHEYGGALVRYWEKGKLYKYVPQFGHAGGGGGGGYGGCSLGGPGIEGVFHEWGHGMPCGGLLMVGGAENAADSLQIMANPAIGSKITHQSLRPWMSLFHGGYPGSTGYEIMSDDPNWGYIIAGATSTLAAQEDTTPMHVFAHLGEERGLWDKKNAIRRVGDMIGQIGARFAEFDCQQEFQFRAFAASANRSYLVPVDIEKRLYRCPTAEAPNPFGVSISRLIPDAGATKIGVDFQGDFDPDTYSDWRACIVAVDKNDRCRYSPLWNKGKMSMEIQPGDKRWWLTVTATPKALMRGRRSATHFLYEGGFVYKYPYQVTLTGATPGSAFGSVVDNNNTGLEFPENGSQAYLPVEGKPHHSIDMIPTFSAAERAALKTQLEKQSAGYREYKASYDAQLEALKKQGLKPDRLLARAIADARARHFRVQFLLDNLDGAPHPNGGGWVSSQAQVDPSAYIGPRCVVLGKAKVLDHAQLIDSAAVIGDGAVVKDHAKLSGKARVLGSVIVDGFARLFDAGEASRVFPDAEIIDKKTTHMSGISSRRGIEAPLGNLLANYDILRDESVLLEDMMILRGKQFTGYHFVPDPINYNGHLVGRPGFEPLSPINGALVFNGEGQYAEIAPEIIDLGELMLVMRVKLDGFGKPQTLLDFGSTLDNRMMLTVDTSGKPVLQWTVKGKREALPVREPLQAGQWATFRVEIDGERVALYVNGQATEKKSDFRSADVFVPPFARRNFVFRSRETNTPDYVAGQLDYLRVYSEVPEDFAALPEPPLMTPTRATAEIAKEMDVRYGDLAGRQSLLSKLYGKSDLLDTAKTWNSRVLLRLYTMQLGDTPEVIKKSLAIRDHYYRLMATYQVKEHQLHKEYMASDEVKQKQAQLAELETELTEATLDFKKKKQAVEEAYKEAPQGSPKALAYKAWEDAMLEKREREQALNNSPKRKELRAKEKAIHDEIVASVKPQQDALQGEYDARKKQYDARIKELTESEGPVAEVFNAALGHVDEASKKDLLKRREKVLNYKPFHGNPPAGLLYRDLKAVEYQERMGRIKRQQQSILTEALLNSKAYVDASAQVSKFQTLMEYRRNRDRHSPFSNAYSKAIEAVTPQLQTRGKRDAVNQERRQIEAGFKPYALARLGDLEGEIDKAKIAWEKRGRENGLKINPDEWRMTMSTYYFRRYYSLATQSLSRAIASTTIGVSTHDQLDQVRAVVELQPQWLLTTDDWDTLNREEKQYESKNPNVQRWLKRVKPYRYDNK